MAVMAVSKICGGKVESRSGEALGEVTEIMIDADSGGIAYAVLSHGGILGVGEKLFAVPWAAFAVNAAAGTLTIDADAGQLAAAPGIDKDAWPADASADWLSPASAPRPSA